MRSRHVLFALLFVPAVAVACASSDDSSGTHGADFSDAGDTSPDADRDVGSPATDDADTTDDDADTTGDDDASTGGDTSSGSDSAPANDAGAGQDASPPRDSGGGQDATPPADSAPPPAAISFLGNTGSFENVNGTGNGFAMQQVDGTGNTLDGGALPTVSSNDTVTIVTQTYPQKATKTIEVVYATKLDFSDKTSIAMTFDGVHSNNDQWYAIVPKEAAGTQVLLYVHAVATAGDEHYDPGNSHNFSYKAQ